MSFRISLILVVTQALAILFSSAAAAIEPAGPRLSTESLSLVFINGEEPLRLELRIEIDGRPVVAVWNETFAQLLSFLDRDGNGTLDRSEAARLPSEFAVRQILWGQFSTNMGNAPSFEEIDRDRDQAVSGEELANYYRRTGLGSTLVGVGQPTTTDLLTDALLKSLDSNQDGQVTAVEWHNAAESLRKFDSNDDELIGPGELVSQIAYPGASGSILLKSPTSDIPQNAFSSSLPFVILAPHADRASWIASLTTSRNTANLPLISADKLAKICTATPPARWQVRLGTKAKAEATLAVEGENLPTDTGLALSHGSVRFYLREDTGKLQHQTTTALKNFAALFVEGDTNSDGMLDEQELGTPKAGQLQHLAIIADRNGDKQLSKPEFAAWLELQQQMARGHVLLTILDHRTGLFELLDADHDGSLSVRESRTAASRLQAANCLTETGFRSENLPRQLIATISHGHPQTSIPRPIRPGPRWFLAMDRNRDGDISIKEWVGDLNVFQKLEVDGDGLLTADEVQQAASK